MADDMQALQKARIYTVDKMGEADNKINIACAFNPYEYAVSKTNTYQEEALNNADVAEVKFVKAGAQTLRLNLTFDSYESGKDVSLVTNQLWKLMEVKTRQESDETKKVPPPDVAFEWGGFRFTAVITNMTQKFTLFKHDGTPVRAKVDVTFTQYKDVNDYPRQNPTSGGGEIQRIWRVTQGDRLDTIAAAVYGDATQWRVIAEYNGIVNPAALRNGQRLTIPQR